jgi:ELWxxDGT repeat protein
MKNNLFFCMMIFACYTVTGQQAELLKDINSGTASSYIIHMTTLQNKVIFEATNKGNTNSEPWVTDGTVQGTFMLKEINPDQNLGSNIGQMIVYNNEVYFNADDGTHGTELWKTDGTTEGTKMVKDIAPGSVYGYPGEFVVFKGALYFKATHPDTGSELWKSDGTTDGTLIVKDLSDGATSTLPGYLFATSSMLYFCGLNDHKLYGSDGSADGTKLVSDKVIVGQSGNAYFTEYLNEVYFNGVDVTGPDEKGAQLWKVSGYTAQRVTAIISNEAMLSPNHLVVASGKLFFIGQQYPFGDELWTYNGLTASMVKDIDPSGHGPGGFITSFKDKVVFSAGDATTGKELWVSDGTENGTKMIKDFYPGSISSGIVSPVIIGDTLYFSADDGTGGELWRLISPDGQPEKFTNITGGGAWGPELARIGKTFVFSAGDATSGTELWKMTLSGSTVIPEVTEGALFRVYPNPATEHLTVELLKDGSWPVTISLYDISGRKVYECKANEQAVTINILPAQIRPGIYLLMMSDRLAVTTVRIMVIK